MKNLIAFIFMAIAYKCMAQTAKHYRIAYQDCTGEIRGAAETKDSMVGGVYRFTEKNGTCYKIEFLKNGKPAFSDKNDAMAYFSSVEITRTPECVSVKTYSESSANEIEHDIDIYGRKTNEFSVSDGAMTFQHSNKVDAQGRILSSQQSDILTAYRYDDECNMVGKEIYCYNEFRKAGSQINYVATDSLRICSMFEYEYDRLRNKITERTYDENRTLKSVATYAYDDRSNIIEWIYSHDDEFQDPTMNNPERVTIKYDSMDRFLEQSVYDSENSLQYTMAIEGCSKTFYDHNREIITRSKYDSFGNRIEAYDNPKIRENYFILFMNPIAEAGIPLVKYRYSSGRISKSESASNNILVEESYFDVDQNPAENDSCVSSVCYVYDDSWEIQRRDYYDISNRLIRSVAWDRSKGGHIGTILYLGKEQ